MRVIFDLLFFSGIILSVRNDENYIILSGCDDKYNFILLLRYAKYNIILLVCNDKYNFIL